MKGVMSGVDLKMRLSVWDWSGVSSMGYQIWVSVSGDIRFGVNVSVRWKKWYSFGCRKYPFMGPIRNIFSNVVDVSLTEFYQLTQWLNYHSQCCSSQYLAGMKLRQLSGFSGGLPSSFHQKIDPRARGGRITCQLNLQHHLFYQRKYLMGLVATTKEAY